MTILTTSAMTTLTTLTTTAATTTAATHAARTTAAAVAPRGATAAAALELVERARAGLLEACHSRGVAERYLQSQLAAMRAAAALVSARAHGRQSGPQSLWDLLPAVAPELTEWAEFFAVTTARSPMSEVQPEPLPGSAPLGTSSTSTQTSTQTSTPSGATVSAREADDLLRQTETFVDLVCRALGLPVAPAQGDVLVPTAWA